MKKKTVLMTCLTMTLLSQTMVCKAAASPLLKVQTAQQDSKTFPKVSGKIFDNNGEPIIGASVIVKGTSNGSVTDMDGNYVVTNVPQGATLVISYVGYKGKEVVASSTSLSNS